MSTETKNSTTVIEGDALAQFFNGDETPTQEAPPEVTETDITTFFDETPIEVVEPAAQKETVTEPAATSFYSDLVKDYLEEGEWEDLEIEIEEGNPVALSELKDITPEVFKEIRAAQKQLKEEQLKEDYIPVKGLSESKKKMIELAKAGGDVRELVDIETNLVNPLQGLDLDSEQVQESILRQKYMSMGWKPKHIESEIQDLKESLQLDLEAKKVIDEVNSNFDKIVETKKGEQLAQIEAAKKEQQEFKKGMTEEFRGLNLKDTLIKNLVDATAKFDEDGLAEVDRIYFNLKADPKKFAKIAFHLINEEAFNEFQGVKIKNDVTKDTIKKVLKITPKSASSSAAPPRQKDALQEFFQQT